MKKPKITAADLVVLAGRPEGVTSKCLPDVPDLSSRLSAAMRDGKIFRGGTGRGRVRYFATPEAAKAYSDNLQPVVQAPPASLKMTFAKDAKTVITADTKVTICPSHPPRFAAIDLPGVMTANQRGRVASEPVDLAPARICPEVQA